MAEFPLFVYGTLRPDPDVGWNRNRGRHVEVREPIRNVTVSGQIYDHGFPVAKLDEEGTIIGDVLFFEDECPEWIDRMEQGAGYVLQPVSVTLEDGSEMGAFAWHYRFHPRGKLIESGDFVAHMRGKGQVRA